MAQWYHGRTVHHRHFQIRNQAGCISSIVIIIIKNTLIIASFSTILIALILPVLDVRVRVHTVVEAVEVLVTAVVEVAAAVAGAVVAAVVVVVVVAFAGVCVLLLLSALLRLLLFFILYLLLLRVILLTQLPM